MLSGWMGTLGVRCLCLICGLAVPAVASEPGARALFPASYGAGDFPAVVAVVDLNGDAIPDLVTSEVSVLLGNGDGTFQAAVFFEAGGGPASVAVADLDGDTVSDLVTANYFGNDVGILLGNGDGTF